MKGNLYFAAILVCIYVVKAEIDATTNAIPTTSASPDTTTPAPATTTFTPITSTSTTPEPTPSTPSEGKWNVTDGNRTCIRANLNIRFKIPVENSTEYILLFPNATTEGSDCNDSSTTQLLKLNFENNYFEIIFEKDDKNIYARNITLSLDSPQGPEFSTYGKFFSVKEGSSYMCKNSPNIMLGNATMEISHIQIQAFVGTEKDFGAVEECEEDDGLNDAIPIAVACSLAGLIIIVLIAYLVGRRRSRQQGYNSV